ncbi:hypothetical protein ACLB2K_068529 [Fragaria x ananassa]
MKTERASLSNEIKEFNSLNIKLPNDVEILHNKLNEASEKFDQFILSSDKASKILFTAKRYNDKTRLGYQDEDTQKKTRFEFVQDFKLIHENLIWKPSKQLSDTLQRQQVEFGPHAPHPPPPSPPRQPPPTSAPQRRNNNRPNHVQANLNEMFQYLMVIKVQQEAHNRKLDSIQRELQTQHHAIGHLFGSIMDLQALQNQSPSSVAVAGEEDFLDDVD